MSRRGPDKARLVLIPSYNTGAKLAETVAEARHYWGTVWVVIDGSTDGSGEALPEQNPQDEAYRILRRATNGGKGAAVFDGLRAAAADGFTHILVMDSDGQHPAAMIPDFMSLSKENPDAMILGVPIFDHQAPRLRVIGRRVSNALAKVETSGAIEDSLFGFRVYPIAPLLEVMIESRSMRGYDFDVEAAVRLCWCGVKAINQAAPVRYFSRYDGGVSHFRYGRDNFLLTAMHARLMMRYLLRRFRPSRH